MAATSHDFWLHNLTAPVWKRLHMLVYPAYGLLIAHVTLGALQSETSSVLPYASVSEVPGTSIVVNSYSAFPERLMPEFGGAVRAVEGIAGG
jgi:DMSO/TMAO reductase YedYZ heme-binding membrane subunit